jgi:hypothetical protein
VSVQKLGSNPITTASFAIEVVNKKNKVFSELYLKPFLPKDQRSLWLNFITNNKIFDKTLLYRPFDTNFSVQTEMKCVLHYDFELLTIRNFASVLTNNFYRRRFTLSKPKIRYAKENNLVKYEVIYLDVIDYNVKDDQSISKKININGIDYYPSTFDNMRQQLEDNGEINPEIRPLHFRTLQANELRVDSYIPCVIR